MSVLSCPIRSEDASPTTCLLFSQNKEGTYDATTLTDLSPPFLEDQPLWIHITGLGNPEAIEKIGQHFNLHPLLIEDILTTKQRPKLEDYGDILYLVIRNYVLKNHRHFETDQINIVIGQNYVLTIQEKPGDPGESVLKYLNQRQERCLSPDEIAYRFTDTVVDHLMVVIETIGREIEKLEDQFIELPDRTQVKVVHGLRREMTRMRRSLWALHETIGQILRCHSPLIPKQTHAYLRDIEDHIHRAMESVEGYRDSTSEMLDLYMSAANNRMNEVIKVLTIISTIFIPLNFIAAIYGMNFEHMPELTWAWGYPAFWVLISLVAMSMLGYFWRKGWL